MTRGFPLPRPVVILGGGGHARVLVQSLRRLGGEVRGCVVGAPESEAGPGMGVPVLGGDATLDGIDRNAVDLVMGLGAVAPGGRRVALFEELKGRGWRFASVVDPTAVVADDAALAEGVQVMAGAVIQPGCRLGCNVIVNTRAGLDHDCRIGDHAHIAPGATLSGDVEIGADTLFGTGAVAIQGRRIGAGCLIAAGAVVVDHIPAGARAMGVPARVMRPTSSHPARELDHD